MILTVCPNPSVDTFAYLPLIKLGLSNRIEKIKEFPGGKGIHVALALQELGAEVELMGIWAGATGSWIKNSCTNQGVKLSGIDIQGSTRKCFTFITTESESDHTEILEPGPQLNEIDFHEFLENYKNSLRKASMVCISGSWPSGSPQDACQQLVKLANQGNVKVFLDCTGVQLKNALKEEVFGLHLNESEYFEACKDFGDDAFEKIECLALTKGKEGLELRFNNRQIHAKVILDKVISTVGSGDCLTAGVCFSVEKDMSTEEIAKFGVACGAANCLREDLGMLYKNDVVTLYDRVEIKN